jgi:NifU-like protein involved in Fe-S cluster formation
MAELDAIYSARILELAASLPKAGRLLSPSVSATAHSKLCGSTITVDVEVVDGRVIAIAQTVKACLLGQASASIVASHAVGSTISEIRRVGSDTRAMLKLGGPSPSGRWADIGALQPVKDYKARHASTLLVFDALDRAFDQLDSSSVAVA